MRKLYLLGVIWLGVSGLYFLFTLRSPTVMRHVAVQPTFTGDAGAWFRQVRPYCNPVEAEVQIRWNPPPTGVEGTGYAAACFAIAGKIEEARSRITTLPSDDRWRAAGIVFNVGHPVADAGDDRAAGPIMELVVEFWPNHYMALYHAGASRWELGDPDTARRYLTEFLENYDLEDGWTASARRMLEQDSGG